MGEKQFLKCNVSTIWKQPQNQNDNERYFYFVNDKSNKKY